MNIGAYCYAEAKRHVVATYSMPLSTFLSSAAFRTVSRHSAAADLPSVENKIAYKILILMILYFNFVQKSSSGMQSAFPRQRKEISRSGSVSDTNRTVDPAY
jgi:hypothetical protein